MDQTITLFNYTEFINEGEFSESRKPFLQTDTAREFQDINYTIFKESGGIYAINYFKNEKTHVRISAWKTKEDYHKWRNHPKIEAYLKLRRDYHKNHGITDLLEGPFVATHFD